MSNKLERYQWVKGERIGEIEILDRVDGEWTYFSSGRRINNEIINEYMTNINHESQVMDIPGSLHRPNYSFQNEGSDRTIRDAEGNVYQAPKQTVTANRTQRNTINQTEIKTEEATKKEKSPVRLLLEQSTRDEVTVNIPITISIPKKNVYNIVKDGFKSNVDKEIEEMVLEALDQSKFKKLLMDYIGKTIKNHYK